MEEVIVLDDDSLDSKPHRKKEKSKRKHKISPKTDKDTFVITQKVDVRKTSYKCVINLMSRIQNENRKCSTYSASKYKDVGKTSTSSARKPKQSSPKKYKDVTKTSTSSTCKHKNVIKSSTSSTCKHKDVVKRSTSPASKYKLARKKSPHRRLYASIDREIPHCMRKQCRWMICKKHKLQKERARIKEEIVEIKAASRRLECSRRSRIYHRRNSHDDDDYSSISSFDFGRSDMSYENVSSTSFLSDTESDLETLIKRTKLREHNQLKNKMVHKETTMEVELVQDSVASEAGRKSRAGSFHSLATLVLDHETERYSPSMSAQTELIATKYSPLSLSPQVDKYEPENWPANESTPYCTDTNWDSRQYSSATDPVFTQSYPYCPMSSYGSYSVENIEDVKPFQSFSTEEYAEQNTLYFYPQQQLSYENVPSPFVVMPWIYDNTAIQSNEDSKVNMNINNNNIDLNKYFFNYWAPKPEKPI